MENDEIVELSDVQQNELVDELFDRMRLGNGETPIDCRRFFKFLCPKVWQDLEPTDEETVRFCSSCRRNVYLCTSREDIDRHAGECVALFYKTRTRQIYGELGEPNSRKR